jgi:hypothetical protein
VEQLRGWWTARRSRRRRRPYRACPRGVRRGCEAGRWCVGAGVRAGRRNRRRTDFRGVGRRSVGRIRRPRSSVFFFHWDRARSLLRDIYNTFYIVIQRKIIKIIIFTNNFLYTTFHMQVCLHKTKLFIILLDFGGPLSLSLPMVIHYLLIHHLRL